MPVLAILGAAALSTAVFFAFTLPQCSKEPSTDVAGDGSSGAGGSGEVVDPEPQPDPEPEPEPEPQPEPEPEPEPVAEKFVTPRLLIGTLVKRLGAGDLDGVSSIISDEILAEPRALGFLHIFGAGGFVPQPGEGFAEIGDVDQMNRWAVYAVPKDSDPTDYVEVRQRVTVDVTKAPEVGWKVAGVHVPAALREVAVAAGVRLPDGTTGEDGVSPDRADPLFVADDFVSSLLSQNFEKALSLCGESVPDEKIAGLCMVFEEGEFRLLKEKPLTTTSLGEGKPAWVFARVRSDKLETNGEFAVELKINPEKGWEVDNVNIESMLQEFVRGSEAGRVPFTPIKKNPDGGDTLVLYFEYDKADLLPRSLRQIDILARILRSDAKKTLNIGGHADALGTDDYNRRLSEARALSVKEALVAAGVPETQIEVTAFGEAKPWKENTTAEGADNPEGRQQNRRAEIYLNF